MATAVAPHRTRGIVSHRIPAESRRIWDRALLIVARRERPALEALAASDREHRPA